MEDPSATFWFCTVDQVVDELKVGAALRGRFTYFGEIGESDFPCSRPCLCESRHAIVHRRDNVDYLSVHRD